MPRQARPKWSKYHGKWYMNAGPRDAAGRATEVYAPAGIGSKDEQSAWAWFKAYAEGGHKPTTATAAVFTTAALCEEYLGWAEARRDAGRLSPVHYGSKRTHLGHFAARCGPRPAAALTPHDVDDMVTALKVDGYSPHYVADICATVSAAFNWAVTARRLAANPVKGFEVPAVPRAAERFAERAEAASFFRHWRHQAGRQALGPDARRYERLTVLLTRVLIHTGARPGELCHLWWSDMRWYAGVTSAGHAYAKAVIPYDRWKTGQATGKPRTIFFPPALARALRRERDHPGRHPVYVFVRLGAGGMVKPWPGGSFLSRVPLRVRRRAITEVARIRAKSEAGLPVTAAEAILARHQFENEGPNRATNYRWRHTCISSLLMTGVDVPTIAELTGTSPAMIFRFYGHLLSGHLAKAAELASSRRHP